MADPFSVSVFAFINSALKLSEYAVKLYGVESENGAFVRMIQRVRLDLEESERLLCVPSVKKKLISTPGKLPWIKGVIISAKAALNEIGMWVERVRVDKEGYGSISWSNRVRWVFNDRDKLLTRRMELSTSHQALSTVLAYLTPLEQVEILVDAAPPCYDDATFFDDLLSPRQKRRKAWDAEKGSRAENKDDGSINKGIYQSNQDSKSGFFTSQPIMQEGVKNEGYFGVSSNTEPPQTTNPLLFPSWSTTTGRRSVSSIHSSTIGPDYSGNSTPFTLLSEPAALECLSISDEVPPTPRSSSRSESSISRRPISPWIFDQSTSVAQQTRGMISPQPLIPSSSWASPQTLSSTYLPPDFQHPTSQTSQSFEGIDACMSGIHSQNSSSPQFTSSALPLLTSPPQFDTPDFLGYTDTFELSTETDAQFSSIYPEDVPSAVVELPYTIHHPIPLQNLPISPKICQSSTQTDDIVELMGDLSMHHSGNRSSPAEISKIISVVQSLPIDSFSELPLTTPVWQEKPTTHVSVSEISGEPYCAIESSRIPPFQCDGDAPIPTSTEIPFHAISKASQDHQQYPLSTISWSCAQPQTQSELQHQYQSQYQPYRHQISETVSQMDSSNPVGTAAQFPIPWPEQKTQQAVEMPLSSPTQEAITAQPAVSAIEKEYSLSRPTTLLETRRRNQKALLELLGYGSYG